MNFQERKLQILQLLQTKGSVHAKELMDKLGASEITIRRDLTVLEEKGLLTRTHGGAMRTELAKDPDLVSFKAKVNKSTDEKAYIARIASGEIIEGDLIYLDCGSTVFGLCEHIKTKKIKVVTNSLPIILELMGTAVDLALIGGEVDLERQAMHGRTAVNQINNFNAAKAFISCDALKLGYGMSALSERGGEITEAMLKQSEKVYLLADSSKFERVSFSKIGNFDKISKIFTDKNLDYDIYKKYKDAGVEIMK